MTEDYRQRVIWGKLARMEIRRLSPAIPTGFRALDTVLGTGGLPRGHIVEWFGPPSCGKTTLALQTVAHIQENGSVAAWVDADRTFDPGYATGLGVTLTRLPVVRPESAEQAVQMARQLLESGAVDLLVVDSVAALVPNLELESGIGEATSGLQARVLEWGLRKMSFTLRRSDSAAIFVNQSRVRPDPAGGEMETSAGGPSLKLYAPIRLAFQPESRLRLRALKNNAAAPCHSAVLDRSEAGGFADPL
jgi:recombination protein RecA